MKTKIEIMPQFALAIVFAKKECHIGLFFILVTITYPKRIKPVIAIKWV